MLSPYGCCQATASIPSTWPNKAHPKARFGPKNSHLKALADRGNGPQESSPWSQAVMRRGGPKKLTPPVAAMSCMWHANSPKALTLPTGIRAAWCPKKLTSNATRTAPVQPRLEQRTDREGCWPAKPALTATTADGHIHSPNTPGVLTSNVSTPHIHSPQFPKGLTPSPRSTHLTTRNSF